MKRPLTLSLTVLAVLASALWIIADDPQEDPAAAEVRRFDAFRSLAEKGDLDARYGLAGLYRDGTGVEADPRAAAQWYRKAAEKGHAPARHALGRMFETGQGVKRNFQKAAKWYGLAAGIGGHAEAQFDLATLYYHGRGVSHDYDEAMKWYRKAARQGHPAAQFYMGAMSEEGWGREADPVEAYAWYTLALRQAERAKARNRRFDPAAARDKLGRKMTRFQIGQAEKKIEALMAGR
jgi:TPR repeat protein